MQNRDSGYASFVETWNDRNQLAREIYLDESLKQHQTVYPAAGTDHSAVRLTIEELEYACGYAPWVDVCKSLEEES